MDRLLGSIIDDYTLYKISQGIIMILILVAVYLGIQIVLTVKFMKNGEVDSIDINSQRKSFIKSIIFIFIIGFFMLIHEFLEGLEKNTPDYATYELFELIALLGLVLLLHEWHKTLKKLRKRYFDTSLPREFYD